MTVKNKKQSGFTLIEMMTVVAVIGFLTSLLLVSLKTARAKARDAKRVGDVHQIITALELYYYDHGDYPPTNLEARETPENGEWEVSYLPKFLDYLVQGGYFKHQPVDPVNQIGVNFSFFGPREGSYYYAYHYYPPDESIRYGCGGQIFSVVAVRQLEGGPNPNLSNVSCRVPDAPVPCPKEGILNTCRDWSNEFVYSIKIVPN